MPLFYAKNCCNMRVETDPIGQTFIVFEGPCFYTGQPYQVKVLPAELEAYNKGAYIQEAFARLSPGDREFLQTGYSPQGWDEAFKYLEEDEEDEDEHATVDN